MNRIISGCVVGALAIAISSPAAAEGSKRSNQAKDPNQKICEDITLVGSRLAMKRVCATRAEWAAKRRRDRDMVDQAQKSPCVVGSVVGGNAVCGGI